MLSESRACASAARAANRLRASLDAGAAPSDTETEGASFTALEAADPVAEMAAVADAVQAALEAGTNPSSIYILAFHPAWERCIARALEARGIAAALPIRGRVAAGDYRDLDRCAPARLLTALALVADPTDALDLSAEERERTVQLASALTAPEPGVNAPSDARAMIARARQRMNAPVFETTEGHVLIGDSAHLTGLTPATLVLCGFVNGFFPIRDYFDATVTTPDKQKLVRATDTRRLYAAAGKATQRLAASWFTSIGLVEAETLKLEIGRVKLRRGERIAVTAPSIYLADIDPGAETCTAEAAETAAAAPSS